jgi:hypothetical protein
MSIRWCSRSPPGWSNSFTGRGGWRSSPIAQSFGKLITGQEKFKDLLGDVGPAFATFTAGILEDVASIIIKYELLKAIKDALGVGPGGDAAGGVGGWLASLFSKVGAAGAAAGAAAPVDCIAGSQRRIISEHGASSTGRHRRQQRHVARGGPIRCSAMRSGSITAAWCCRRDEIPIIAQRGEKIVSLAQQRTEAAQKVAQKSQEGTSIRNVLAVGDKESRQRDEQQSRRKGGAEHHAAQRADRQEVGGLDDAAVPVPARLVEPITERLSWLTAIQTSPTGAEQREALRLTPRRAIDIRCMLDAMERSYFDVLLAQNGGGKWWVPIPHEEVRVGEVFVTQDEFSLRRQLPGDRGRQQVTFARRTLSAARC